jgi:predicted nuclease with TOPRIM domain
MTNQVNQEAFEKWLKANYPEYPPPLSKVWQAATQASESEINSLKQRVEELEAHNNQLREALEKTLSRPKLQNEIDEILSSTPEQSLAEHDNEVIDRCKNIVADDALAITFQSMGAYRSAIIKQIGELKVTP